MGLSELPPDRILTQEATEIRRKLIRDLGPQRIALQMRAKFLEAQEIEEQKKRQRQRNPSLQSSSNYQTHYIDGMKLEPNDILAVVYTDGSVSFLDKNLDGRDVAFCVTDDDERFLLLAPRRELRNTGDHFTDFDTLQAAIEKAQSALKPIETTKIPNSAPAESANLTAPQIRGRRIVRVKSGGAPPWRTHKLEG